MFFSAIVLAAVALPVAFVGAQTTTTTTAIPTSTDGISPCIIQCATQAESSASCTNFQDLQCACTSAEFQNTALSCLQANCTTTDLQDAQTLQRQECANVTGAITPSAAPTATPDVLPGSVF